MRNSLGWDYPAGVEHSPRAPWNAPVVRCVTCGEQTDDCECEEPKVLTKAEEREHYEQERSDD